MLPEITTFAKKQAGEFVLCSGSSDLLEKLEHRWVWEQKRSQERKVGTKM